MAWTHDFTSRLGAVGAEERAERALRWPVGLASPLWAVFGAAAGCGIAYWWMRQWTRAVNVEALAVAAPVAVEIAAAVDAPGPPPAKTEAEPTPEPVSADVDPVLRDDLTAMTGIGPKLEAALFERGVMRFEQIAAWTADDLAEVDVALSLKGRAVREAWVAQAKRLAARD